ncbi:MgtC/SapB family protein [Psychrilyobacter sp.]|uniref:MgtC/SapB family protein n=1 Tax=Psychrilyobacter sp. TaxID=2586924 RepID=UPI003017F4A1
MELLLLKLISAIIIGGAIGIERKKRGKPAGLVTNILVCLGSTLIAIEQQALMMTSINLINENPNLAQALKVDVGRLTAQVISGIGFLGGGVILQTKESVKGITTAATLWVVAAIGISLGSGHFEIAYTTFIATLIVLIFIKKIEVSTLDRRIIKKISIEYYENDTLLEELKNAFLTRSIKVSSTTIIQREILDNEILIKKQYILNIPKYINIKHLIRELRTYKYIKTIN